MHVNLCLFNHDAGGRATLQDQVAWVTAGLEECGHTVSYSETQVLSDALNLFWESFPPVMSRWLADNRIPFGIVATEVPDGAGFNNRRDPDWAVRWDGFRQAARAARFIWCLLEDATSAYAQLAPTAYLELGFTERLVPREPRPTPGFDFSFAGVPREHRQRILDALGQRATVAYAGGVVSQADQLRILRQGRIGLALKQSPDWRWASPARLGRLVHERIPTAAEYTPVEVGVSRLVPKPAADQDFVAWALARLEQAVELEREAERAFEAYRATPMRECVARALDLTLGSN